MGSFLDRVVDPSDWDIVGDFVVEDGLEGGYNLFHKLLVWALEFGVAGWEGYLHRRRLCRRVLLSGGPY